MVTNWWVAIESSHRARREHLLTEKDIPSLVRGPSREQLIDVFGRALRGGPFAIDGVLYNPPQVFSISVWSEE